MQETLEARAKAQLATGLDYGELDPILDSSVPSVLATATGTLADQLGKPSSFAALLLEKLRILQAIIDEPGLAALKIRDLLSVGPPQPVKGYTLTRLDWIFGAFEHAIRPSAWDVNETPVTGPRVVLAATPPALLAPGRHLVLERDGHAVEVVVTAVDPLARTLDLSPALTAGDAFRVGNMIIRGNVVRAGHGETRPAKVLGAAMQRGARSASCWPRRTSRSLPIRRSPRASPRR